MTAMHITAVVFINDQEHGLLSDTEEWRNSYARTLGTVRRYLISLTIPLPVAPREH